MSKTSTVKGQRLSGRDVVKKIFQIREIVILLLVLVLAVVFLRNNMRKMNMA